MPVTGFEITFRRPVADGHEFSAAGAYEEIKGVVKLGAGGVVSEPFPGTDMIAEFAAQVVVEAALCQAGEELSCQGAEAITTSDSSDRALDLSRVWFE